MSRYLGDKLIAGHGLLYDTTGSNTDGAMTQKAATDNFVNADGDSMSGDLYINKSNPKLFFQATNADISNSDTANIASYGLQYLDKNNNVVGYLTCYENGNNNHGLSHGAKRTVNGTTITAEIIAGINSSGVPYYSVINYANARGNAGDLLVTTAINWNTNGYFKLNNGWIIQKGNTTLSSDQSAYQVTLPTAFSNTNYAVCVTSTRANSSGNGWDYISSKTTTSFKMCANAGSVQWIAIGI